MKYLTQKIVLLTTVASIRSVYSLNNGPEEFDYESLSLNNQFIEKLDEYFENDLNPVISSQDPAFTDLSYLDDKFHTFLEDVVSDTASRAKRSTIEKDGPEMTALYNKLKKVKGLGGQRSNGKVTLDMVLKVYNKLVVQIRRKFEKVISEKKKKGEVVERADEDNLFYATKDLKFGQYVYKLMKKQAFPIDNEQMRYSMMYKILMKDTSQRFDLSSTFGQRSLTCSTSSCSIPISWTDIFGYGCWCNFRSEITMGYGQAVDEYDEICRTMQYCTRCVGMDQNDTCDLATTDYEINLFVQGDGTTSANCDVDNAGNDCAIGLCQCDLQFHVALTSIIAQGSPPLIVEGNKHVSGFNRNTQCIRFGFGSGKGLSCCGTAPNWRPYNALVDDCCSGVVESFGSC